MVLDVYVQFAKWGGIQAKIQVCGYLSMFLQRRFSNLVEKKLELPNPYFLCNSYCWCPLIIIVSTANEGGCPIEKWVFERGQEPKGDRSRNLLKHARNVCVIATIFLEESGNINAHIFYLSCQVENLLKVISRRAKWTTSCCRKSMRLTEARVMLMALSRFACEDYCCHGSTVAAYKMASRPSTGEVQFCSYKTQCY